VLANTPAIAPMGESRSSGAIMRGLAEKMGLDHPALRESDAAIAASALPDGWHLEDLAHDGWRKSSPPRPAIAPRAQKLRIADRLVAPNALPDGRLQLLSPKSHYFLNSTFANMSRHQASQGAPAIALHPAEARRRGLTEGALVKVSNDAASLEVTLKVSEAVRPGVATLEGKWWEQEQPRAAMNLLTPSRWSPAGQPAYNEVFITIEAITPPQ
jgi:anaerobic selenocysteine-containing dehydrogenase